MKKMTILVAVMFTLCTPFLFAEQGAQHNLDPYNPEYVPEEILIKFTDDTEIDVTDKNGEISVGIDKIDALLQKYEITEIVKVFKTAEKRKEQKFIRDFRGNEIEVPQLFNIYKMKVPEETDIEQAIDDFGKDSNVDYAEPNYLVYTMDTYPDDPYYTGGNQWYIDEVNAPAAWDSTTCDSTQIIGIIDTGVDWTHPDLDSKIWTNYSEIPANGIDDDGNGYVDDVRGWDYVNDDNDPNDDNSHGTHVAGIAAAETDNGVGIAGISWNAKIMPVKMLQSSGAGSSSDLASAIDYAANNGAEVINMSLGSYGESMTVKTALENAYAYAVLVAAAGNNGYKVDPQYPPWPPYAPMYPACYGFVIGVEASTQTGGLAGFSNFDPSGPIVAANYYGHNYEIKAPGVGIYSTFPNGNYNSLNGTSMASPIVAGAVILMKSYNPTQSTEQIFARLIQGANNGILDIGNSLDYELVPDLYFVEYTLVDTLPGCDDDGIADAGETIEIYLTVKNAGGWADSVWTKLRFATFEDTTVANIVDSTGYIGDISAYATLTGELDPFRIEIDPNVSHNRTIVFEIEIGAKNSNSFTTNINLTISNGEELSGVMDTTLILIPNKLWLVNSSFRVGANGNLIIKPGVEILISQTITVRGEINAIGNKDSLIEIGGENHFGPPFQFENPPIANFKYVSFTNFTSPLGNYNSYGSISVDFCIFEDIYNEIGNRLNSSFSNNIIKNSHFGNSMWNANPIITEKNVFYKNLYTNFTVIHGSFKYNTFVGNVENTNRRGIIWIHSIPDSNDFNYNSIVGTDGFSLVVEGSSEFIDLFKQYWGTTDSSKIRTYIYDFYYNSSNPLAIFDDYLHVPSDSCHGFVWKVLINNIDPQDEQLDPIGSETVKFDVYFNRAMDTTYTPFLTFGVREPYTQNIVTDSSSWSADSTVWTAYKTIGLETGDGIQTVRVANAKDDEYFEIPIEDSRFEFVIQAAGAASIDFIATAGFGKVDLEWPYAETSDVLGYNMYRFENITDSTFSDTTLINTELIIDSTYTDFAVIPDTTYHYLYKIVGTDMQESDFSKSVSATPISAPNGDANGDLEVDVLDITSIVAYMLGQNPEPFLFDAADINYDGSINVLDIIGVVNIILGSKSSTYASAEPATIRLKDNVLELESTGNVAGLQFELTGSNLKEIKLISQMEGFELATSIDGNKLTGVIYNLTGKALPKGIHSLIKIENDHKLELSNVIAGNSVGTSLQITIDDGSMLIPDRFIMHQNYPNPFKNTTTIEYALAKPARVTISIYNIRGQLVKRYKVGEQDAGYYDIVWNGKNEQDRNVGNGVYFYKLKADMNEGGSFEKIKKVLVIR